MKRIVFVALALVLVGIVSIGVPVAFPPEDVYMHDTSLRFNDPQNASETIQKGNLSSLSSPAEIEYQLVSYQNLSDRGKTIYRDSLRAEDNYWVTEGAEDWTYGNWIVLKRPTDSTLPPADEENGSAQFDVMSTWQDSPPYTSVPWLSRLGLLAFGVITLTVGGYLLIERR